MSQCDYRAHSFCPVRVSAFQTLEKNIQTAILTNLAMFLRKRNAVTLQLRVF